MDQSLEALRAFVLAQRILLEKIREDVRHLDALKRDIGQARSTGCAHVLDELARASLAERIPLGNVEDCRLVPPQLHWSAFEKCDAAPLLTLARTERDSLEQRTRLRPSRLAAVSELQDLVRHARATIVDPVLELCSEEEHTWRDQHQESVYGAHESRIVMNRQGKGAGKRTKIQASALSLPRCVYILRDGEDENADVDVTLEDRGEDGKFDPGGDGEMTTMPELVLPQNVVQLSVTSKSTVTPCSTDMNTASRTSGVTSTRRTVRIPCIENPKPRIEPPDQRPMSTSHPKSKPSKPRPETYKQAWSTSEQHLLERLLEQVPAGEPYRWLKISRAMDGRRTPRQVASRVQKYFEKMRRFGVEGEA